MRKNVFLQIIADASGTRISNRPIGQSPTRSQKLFLAAWKQLKQNKETAP